MKIKTSILIIMLATSFTYGQGLIRTSPLESEKNIERNTTTVRNLILDCLERGSSLSCKRAADWHSSIGENTVSDAYYNEACELGSGDACMIMAEKISNSGQDAKKAYKKACLENNLRACEKLKESSSVDGK